MKIGIALAVSITDQWQDTSGLIKVIPTTKHESVTTRLMFSVNDALFRMGLDWADAEWVGNTTYKPTAAKGKQPDNAFVPPSRCAMPVDARGWPTLVIETGLSESLTQLRADAAKWFVESNGDVRIVWQLAPVGAPVPLTRAYIASLREAPNMPTLFPQVPATQQPYCAQEITITQQSITGDPLVLPFHALYDRVPGQGESDVLIKSADFRSITWRLW